MQIEQCLAVLSVKREMGGGGASECGSYGPAGRPPEEEAAEN